MQPFSDVETSPQLGTGVVYRKTLGQYGVRSDGQVVDCALSNKLRKQLVYPIADPSSLRRRVMAVEDIRAVDPVAIGDVVRFVDAGPGMGMITEVLPRKNKLVRRAAGPKPLEQVIVANVDQVVAIVAASHPAPKWELLDRYLAAAESLGLPTLALITKLDLVTPEALTTEVQAYRQIGYQVLLTSVITGKGLDALKDALSERVSVLVGPSGVGKTSLLNALQPGLGQRVGAVSHSNHKGKHTTTHLELFALDWGGGLVDTPGMREFGLWDVAGEDLAAAFPEMRHYLGRCQFGLGCSHAHEPGCVIKEAVAAGHIHGRRYQSYLRMRE